MWCSRRGWSIFIGPGVITAERQPSVISCSSVGNNLSLSALEGAVMLFFPLLINSKPNTICFSSNALYLPRQHTELRLGNEEILISVSFCSSHSSSERFFSVFLFYFILFVNLLIYLFFTWLNAYSLYSKVFVRMFFSVTHGHRWQWVCGTRYGMIWKSHVMMILAKTLQFMILFR